MDIIYEKFGWMLLMLDIVMVPFIFPLQAYYIYKVPAASQHSTSYYSFFLFVHCFGYWLFDTANSQKCHFRQKPGEEVRSGFPERLPWYKLKNPKYIQTERGTKLLCSGWWGMARHVSLNVHYAKFTFIELQSGMLFHY